MKVPEGWSKKTLEDIANVSSGGTPSRGKPEYWNGAIPWVTTAEIDFCEIFDTTEKITQDGLNNSSAKLFPIGTVLLAMYGQGKTRGKVAKLGIEATTNQACAAIVFKHNFCVDYYYQYLRSQYDNIRNLSNSGSQENLSGSIVKSIQVPAPPLPEQQKIAQILSTWDKAITTTEQLLANSQHQKKALMQQLLTGKKRLLDEDGVRFGERWNHSTIGKIGLVKSAGVDKKVVEGEVPVRLLNFTDVFNNSFIHSQDLNHWVTAPPSKIRDCDIRKGDVFFTPSSETREEAGIPAVAAEDISECCYSYHVVRYRINEPWDLNFKAYAFTTPQFRKQVNRLADGSGQRYVVSQDSFRSILISYPDIAEQKKIGGVLKIAENEVDLLQTKLEALKQEKKALMQQLLTGKRRVKLENCYA
ncbi:MAG: restriction endonuclease subunit S [Burkholderiales bacterium]|nr:restriction endonuclease subunit S [Burkholderiales bacterium]